MKSKNLTTCMLKRRITTLALCSVFLFNILPASAQSKKNRPDKKVKIETLRKKYFNEKLALSDAEQKAFWPLYTEYKQKDRALRDSFKSKYKTNDVIFMDDKQAEAYLEATIKLKDDQNNLYKEYISKFKKVITIKKVAMLAQVERDFKKEIFKQAREHHKSGAPPQKSIPDED